MNIQVSRISFIQFGQYCVFICSGVALLLFPNWFNCIWILCWLRVVHTFSKLISTIFSKFELELDRTRCWIANSVIISPYVQHLSTVLLSHPQVFSHCFVDSLCKMLMVCKCFMLPSHLIVQSNIWFFRNMELIKNGNSCIPWKIVINGTLEVIATCVQSSIWLVILCVQALGNEIILHMASNFNRRKRPLYSLSYLFELNLVLEWS